jgi:tetratricopeptide (TPR) repeat protein
MALAIVAVLAAPLLSEAHDWLGVRFDARGYPVGACDFIERNGLRGRFYNVFQHGGYLLWRFWPDRGRLPFMDAHQSGSRQDRDGVAYAVGSFETWQQMDARHRFEMVLVPRYRQVDLPLPDHLDADSTFALVFVDDAVALYLRRDEPRFAPVIAREEFHLLGGGTRKIEALQAVIYRDSTARRALERELDRSIASTGASSRALYLRGSIAAFEDRLDDAVADFRAGIAADRDARRAHEGIGAIAAVRGRPREAIVEYRLEAAKFGWVGGLAMRMADAYAALGDLGAARHWYERELKADPGNTAARDSLAAIGSRRS